jgi:signal transduction histidine kinase
VNQLQQYFRGWSPAARLALGYVAIIMAISLLFTVALFRLSSGQLEESLRHEYLRIRPTIGINPVTGGPSIDLTPDVSQYQMELDDGRKHLALKLVYFNLIILTLGSLASYQLARRTLRPIEEALEAQTRFSGDASHELRTPLTAMQSEIEVALRNSKLSAADARKLLQSNLEEVAKLKNLSDGLLRLARGTSQLERGPVDLAEAVNQAEGRLTKLAQSKQIKFSRQGGTVIALGDAQTLVELISILLDNAIKYSPSGSTVTVELSKQNKQAVITVLDQGSGVADADLPHIFERFYRADSSRSKDQVDGYGLGLSIAQKIVEAHDGSITVRNNHGASFTVRLPLA